MFSHLFGWRRRSGSQSSGFLTQSRPSARHGSASAVPRKAEYEHCRSPSPARGSFHSFLPPCCVLASPLDFALCANHTFHRMEFGHRPHRNKWQDYETAADGAIDPARLLAQRHKEPWSVAGDAFTYFFRGRHAPRSLWA